MLWQSREFDDHEQVCFFSDEATGLRAIIAIHSTTLGPAVGGTRFKEYETDAEAIDDALRLSRAMSYKSALAGLPFGGGKAVVIGAPARLKGRPLLHSFGHYLNRVGPYFATGEDVGMTVEDIDIIREVSPFVGGTSDGAGDPSVHTAAGLVHGLHAVARCRFGKSDLQGLRVAIQGLGAVGWRLAERLHAAGASLVVADVRAERTEAAAKLFGAVAMPPEQIHAADVDIYAPCALGGVITDRHAREIVAGAVAGAANNQLASERAGEILAERGILFAPDYVINAGGVISGLEAASQMPGRARETLLPLDERLTTIHDRLVEIFERSRRERTRPELVAEAIARELIGRAQQLHLQGDPLKAEAETL
ncbi:MAG: Glu/Leu/Phe/Val dehydrogenase dimerization domain-containing protein [Pseudomonadota bacterium]|nr:Glu/Leu/Phe/Val dehydrogenase dimerization domain-containing protein [Pseudomonadota bacterium]